MSRHEHALWPNNPKDRISSAHQSITTFIPRLLVTSGTPLNTSPFIRGFQDNMTTWMVLCFLVTAGMSKYWMPSRASDRVGMLACSTNERSSMVHCCSFRNLPMLATANQHLSQAPLCSKITKTVWGNSTPFWNVLPQASCPDRSLLSLVDLPGSPGCLSLPWHPQIEVFLCSRSRLGIVDMHWLRL